MADKKWLKKQQQGNQTSRPFAISPQQQPGGQQPASIQHVVAPNPTHMEEMKQHYEKLLHARCEENFQVYKQRTKEMKQHYEKLLQAKDEMEKRHKEQLLLADKFRCDRCVENMRHYYRRVEEKDHRYKEKARCGRCEENMQQHDQSMKKTEQGFQEELHQERTALTECEKEFDSFKNRMAANLKIELQTGDCEIMDSPVCKTRLTSMYEELIFIKWTEIRRELKATNEGRHLAVGLIQGMFEASRKDMDEKKKRLEEMFAFHKHRTSPSPKDATTVYRKLAAQNLQMIVYLRKKEDVVQVPFREYQKRVWVPGTFRRLAAECYWLGCLMALNNPPLQPDWASCIPGPDAWNIFPTAIKHIILPSVEPESLDDSL